MIKLKQLLNEILENNLSEEYPTNWNLETFKALKSFAKRIKYCNENLKRMASGSARVIYKIDDKLVLKLAKNDKGIAQNGAESDGFVQGGSYEDIIAKVYASDNNNLWLEMELAKKLTPTRFSFLMGFTLDSLSNYLFARDYENHGKAETSAVYKKRIPVEQLEKNRK